MALFAVTNKPPDIVLIVDDDPAIRTLLVRLVQAVSNYHPLAPASATEGYLRLAELRDRVALLLLDVTMDGMDGFEFREMQLAGPAARVPTVVLTGRHLDPEELARLSPAAALLKPVSTAGIRDCIARYARRAEDPEGFAHTAVMRSRREGHHPQPS